MTCFYRTPHVGDKEMKVEGYVIQRSMILISAVPLNLSLSPAGRDWQPPFVSNVFNLAILFSADVHMHIGCWLLRFLYGEGIPQVCAVCELTGDEWC